MRFSLKSMLVWTGAIAIYCGILFGLPIGVSLFVLIVGTMLVMPSTIVTGIVYARGPLRAFFIGCGAAGSWALLIALYFATMIVMTGGEALAMFADADDDAAAMKWGFAILHGATVFSGVFALGVRWLCIRGRNVASGPSSAQPSPAVVLFDPRDKAELYAILQGRMAGESLVTMNGSNSAGAAGDPLVAPR
jgi:hypothetical protein